MLTSQVDVIVPPIVVAAIVTACLPCITFGQIAEILAGGEMSKSPLLPLLSCTFSLADRNGKKGIIISSSPCF